VTLPALMQDVQTLSRLGLPATMARTRWIFGFQRRLVFFFDQGTLWPNPGLLPHTSHTAATGVRSPIEIKTGVDVRCGQPEKSTRQIPAQANRCRLGKGVLHPVSRTPRGFKGVAPLAISVVACQPGSASRR
jgi:hypothetical protein